MDRIIVEPPLIIYGFPGTGKSTAYMNLLSKGDMQIVDTDAFTIDFDVSELIADVIFTNWHEMPGIDVAFVPSNIDRHLKALESSSRTDLIEIAEDVKEWYGSLPEFTAPVIKLAPSQKIGNMISLLAKSADGKIVLEFK